MNWGAVALQVIVFDKFQVVENLVYTDQELEQIPSDVVLLAVSDNYSHKVII